MAAEALIRFFENVVVQHQRGTAEPGKRSRPGLAISAEEARRLHAEWTTAYRKIVGRFTDDQRSVLAERLRIAYTRATQALDAVVKPVARSEQSKLKQMVATIAEQYQESYGAGRDRSARVGRKIEALVLTDLEYEAARRREDEQQSSEWIHAVLKHNPNYAKRQLKALYYPKALPAERQNLSVKTKLTTNERSAIALNVPTDPQRGAGFYSRSAGRFFVRLGNTSLAVVAHELGHAYAAAEWDEALLKLAAIAPGTQVRIWEIDEAVTSAIADLVLAHHHVATSSGPPYGPHPSGYVGYGGPAEILALKFLHAVDGKSSPGRTTLEAFFDGAVAVENKPDPILRLGRKRKSLRLSKLLD